jgi:hypothetical protein
MKKITAICSLFCLVTTISLAQQKKLQLSFNINLIDANAAAEFTLSGNSTLYTAIGFGVGSVNSLNLNKYFDKSEHNKRGTDVVHPEIFLAPYFNIQYRNYFLRASNNRNGSYTGNNSGMYAGARLKMYAEPVIAMSYF